MITPPSDPALLSSISHTKISNIIIDRITSAIADGSLKPGDKIPTEQEFSSQLGVARNVVREAIKVLEAFGIVEIRRADGTYVSDGYNPQLLNPLFYGIILSDYTDEELIHYRISLLYSTLYMVMRRANDDELNHYQQKVRQFYDAVRAKPPQIDFFCEELQNVSALRDSLCHNPMMTQVDGMSARLFNRLRTRAIRNAIERNDYMELMDSLLFEADIIAHRAMNKLSTCLDRRIAIWLELSADTGKERDPE